MAQRPRRDGQGLFLNIGNRGVGRRTIFEREQDFRFFLALLAVMVRAGEIEVHAFVLMPNHFHLLVRSLRGRISEVMQWVQYRYARRFNFLRERPGHLFTARFWSEVIEDCAYWENLVRYIDRNPVSAGLAASPAGWPYGSAALYASGRPKIWMKTDLIDATIRSAGGAGTSTPGQYPVVFGGSVPPGFLQMMEGACSGQPRHVAPLEALLRGPDRRIEGWLRELALEADGTAIRCGFLSPAVLLEALGTATVPEGFATTLEVGLLVGHCGQTLDAAALRAGISRSTACRRRAEHRRRLLADRAYLVAAAGIIGEAVRREYPSPVAAVELSRQLEVGQLAQASMFQSKSRRKA